MQAQGQLDLLVQGLGGEQLGLSKALQSLLRIEPTLLGKSHQGLLALFVAEHLVGHGLGDQDLAKQRPQQAVIGEQSLY